MNCKLLDSLLSSYIDDETDKKTTEEIAAHLSACDSCRKEYENLLNIKKCINSLPIAELPNDFYSNIKEKTYKQLPQEPEQKPWILPMDFLRNLSFARAGILLASTVLILVMAKFLLLNNNAKIGMDRLVFEHLTSVRKESMNFSNPGLSYITSNLNQDINQGGFVLVGN